MAKNTQAKKKWITYKSWNLSTENTINFSLETFYRIYRKNTDLRRCIEEISTTTWKDWYIIKKNGEVIENDEKFRQIFAFERWLNDFKNKIIRDLIVSGNTYITTISNPFNEIIWYQILDPRTIYIIADKHGSIIWYIQKNLWNSVIFTVDEVSHFTENWDPDNEIFGLWRIEGLVYDALSDEEASRSNQAFFKNNAIPAALISLDTVSEDESIQAIEQLKKQFSWWKNKHKIAVANWIKDVKILWQSIKDMEFISLRYFTTEKICAAIWVPKTILGYSDNVNYSTSDNQYRKFIENTIRPYQNLLSAIFTKILKKIDDTLTFEFIDNHNFDLDSKVARIEKLIWLWLKTIDEWRVELWDQPYNLKWITDIPIIKQWYELAEDIGLNSITKQNDKVN